MTNVIARRNAKVFFLFHRDMETLSINTCRLHGSPKMSSSKQASPHHHPRLSRVQTLDLMDDIPLPFHTGKHTINLMA